MHRASGGSDIDERLFSARRGEAPFWADAHATWAADRPGDFVLGHKKPPAWAIFLFTRAARYSRLDIAHPFPLSRKKLRRECILLLTAWVDECIVSSSARERRR